MERLSELYQLIPDELTSIRSIGPVRMDLIGDLVRFYEAMTPPDRAAAALRISGGAAGHS